MHWRTRALIPQIHLAAVLIGCLGFAFAPLPGVAAEPEARPKVVVTSIPEYWQCTNDYRNEKLQLRLDLVVLYYDPLWKLLWTESDGFASYIPTSGAPLPMKSGQRVRLEGTVIPADGISGDLVKVTVLAEQAHPAPVSTRGLVNDVSRLDLRWAVADGFVCGQREADGRHLLISVLSEGRIINAHILLGETEAVPQFTDRRIRMHFVYVGGTTTVGRQRTINGWVPASRYVQVQGWIDDEPQFAEPPTAIDRLGQTETGKWVRIAGEVRARDPGRSLTVRDATGQVTVETEQPTSVEPGQHVDVVGRVLGRNLEVALAEPLFRVVAGNTETRGRPAGESAAPLLKFRLADQVKELTMEEAARRHPVALSGIVTWADPNADFFFLQDSSSGIRVQLGKFGRKPPLTGLHLTLNGNTLPGHFAPELELEDMAILSQAATPPAVPVTLEQALTGTYEAQRVEMRGYLRSVERAGQWLQLNLTCSTGEFTSVMAHDPAIEGLVGSMVRISGVCAASTSAQRLLTGIRLWAAGAASVHVEQPPPADPYSAPLRSIESMRQFSTFRVLDRPVRLAGHVLFNVPGRHLFLQEGKAGILVLHRSDAVVKPGDWIEAVGLPGRDGNRPVLRDAIWRPADRDLPAPTPLVISRPVLLDPDADARLVTVRAMLQDRIAEFGSQRLMMAANDVRFEARLNGSAAGIPASNSALELTGVYLLDYDEYRRPRSFHLQLRDPADIRVVKAAPWMTAARARVVAGLLGLCTMLVVVWVVVLRRRVQQQTAQIKAQLENEARLHAELERATRLESLGVLAGGIAHDFNNLLTVIMSNLGLAAMDDRVREAAGDIIADAEKGARRAAELTQQLLTFAKGGDPVRRAVELSEVVREAAGFARHSSPVRCDFDFQPNLPPANADPGQISRVVHNLVLNAAQAMPEGGVIRLGLSAVTVAAGELKVPAGPYVKLTVEDNGPGIAPERLARIFEPYFSTKTKNSGLGLATVHSIIKKHQGQVKVHSELGKGTRFDLWLPVAAGPVAPAAAPAPKTPAPSGRARVLFMDDEDVIRRAGSSVLQRLGHDVVAVPDGADAVREYETALKSGKRFDVVIMDLTVPGGMGGKAAMERLREIDPQVRAIVSSGYSNDPVMANYQAYGFCAMVPKPYQVDDLSRTLHEVLGRTPTPDGR